MGKKKTKQQHDDITALAGVRKTDIFYFTLLYSSASRFPNGILLFVPSFPRGSLTALGIR